MPNPTEITKKISYLLLAILKLGKKDMDKNLKKSGLSHLQFGVLRLVRSGTTTIAEISKKMVIEPATLVPVVDALEAKKMLQRKNDLKDRRKNLLLLTKEGTKAIAAVPLIDQNSAFAKALKKIGAVKAEQLAGLMEQLVAAMAPNQKFLDEVDRIIK